MANKKKLFIVTTVPMSFIFFKGQLLLLKEEFNVTLISSPELELFKTAEFNNVKSHGILMKREISLLNDLLSLFNLIRYFHKSKPDIVHGNTPKGSFLSMVAAYFCKVPTRIYYVHGLRYQGIAGLKRKLLMTMEKLSCYFATEIIAVSQGVIEVLIADEITKKPIHIIWNGSINGIDLQTYDPENPDVSDIRDVYKIDGDDFVFGFVGRLVGDKGINELIASFDQLCKKEKNIKLLLVGGLESELDPLQEETLRIMEANDNIIPVGIQKDIRSFLSAMNMFVFPSYREGFGIVLMEAAAMNVPAISTDITGCNEIIENAVNGFLIPARDKKALYIKMKYCLDHQNQIMEMSKITREMTAIKYEQQKLWKKTVAFYKSLT